jgi:hypothetical protein
VVFQQDYDLRESFACRCWIPLNIAVEQRLQRIVKAAAAKDFREHHTIVFERKPIDEVNQIEDRLAFA